ncbi:MAG: SDR family oxidoreductase [Flavobacteriales bacterium]|nr:SDR family oxidoreductase [Flavobacteriales bacterium]
MNFSSKTVWITGASSGIGRALALELSNQGATLILSSRRTEALEEVRNTCHNPEVVHVLPLDLSQADQMPERVQAALKLAPQGIDIVVHSGGISQRSLAAETDLTVDRKLMEIDYFGTIALTKAVLPHFEAQQYGHFAVITSLAGKFGAPMRSSYSAAKHALHGYFETLYLENWRSNLSVTIVVPGLIRTNISKNALVGDGSKQNSMDNMIDEGMSPEACAKKMAKAIYRKKHEVYIGKKEILAIYLKRYLPGLLRNILKKRKLS